MCVDGTIKTKEIIVEVWVGTASGAGREKKKNQEGTGDSWGASCVLVFALGIYTCASFMTIC